MRREESKSSTDDNGFVSKGQDHYWPYGLSRTEPYFGRLSGAKSNSKSGHAYLIRVFFVFTVA